MESTTLVKAFGLLEATAGAPQGRPLGELAAVVGLTKPTAHRLLKTLATLGYIERMGSGIYRQTAKIRRLVTGEPDRRLLELSAPILTRLHDETGETVNLGVLRHGAIVYLSVMESPQPLRRVATPDSSDPFYSTAMGRAIVAHLPSDQRRLLLRTARIASRTPKTVTDRDALSELLDDVKKRGYSIEEDQTDLGVTCIGAPIFDAEGVVAAISLSMPTARADRTRRGQLVEAVRGAADQITEQLKVHPEPALPPVDLRSGVGPR